MDEETQDSNHGLETKNRSARSIFQFFGVLNKVTTKSDGGARIELDCSRDDFEAIQGLQALHVFKGGLIAIAAVPVEPGEELEIRITSEADPHKG